MTISEKNWVTCGNEPFFNPFFLFLLYWKGLLIFLYKQLEKADSEPNKRQLEKSQLTCLSLSMPPWSKARETNQSPSSGALFITETRSLIRTGWNLDACKTEDSIYILPYVTPSIPIEDCKCGTHRSHWSPWESLSLEAHDLKVRRRRRRRRRWRDGAATEGL